RRDPAIEHLRAGRGGQALGDHDVLDGDRHTGERVQLLTGGATRIDVARGGERVLLADVEEGVEVAVHGRDAVQVSAGELLGGGLPGGERSGLGGGAATDLVGGAGGVGHALSHSSPRICGTAKRPSCASGAPASASSCVRVSVTTCSRKTFVMAMGWEVAGTSSEATSETEATASMMESNSPAKRAISSSVSWIRARSARRATSSRPIEGMGTV